MYRHVKGTSGDEFFVIHVPGMNARRSTVDFSVRLGGRDPHAAKKWMERNLNSRREFRHHALSVQRDDLDLAVGEILRQKTTSRSEAIVGIRNGEIDLLNTHFQGVARLGFLDKYRPIQNVSPGASIGNLPENVAQFLFDLVWGDSGLFQSLRTVSDHSMELYRVPGVNVQHGLRGSVVISEGDGFRGCIEHVFLSRECCRRGSLSKAQGRNQAKQDGFAHDVWAERNTIS